MDTFELARIKRTERKATPGPWSVTKSHPRVRPRVGEPEHFGIETESKYVDSAGHHHVNKTDDQDEHWVLGCVVNAHSPSPAGVLTAEDAEFIANAREDVPRLVSEVERLHDELDRTKRFVEEAEALRTRIDQLEREAEARTVETNRLKEDEARLKILFENAPDGYYLSDLKGNFVDGNRAAEEICGYSRDELIGKNFLMLDLLTPSQVAVAAKLLAQNALGLASGPDEFSLKRKDGRRVPVEIRTYPVTIQGSTLILGIARDISARKRAEDEARRVQKRYALATSAARVGAWEWDLATNAMSIDPAVKAVLGFQDSQIENLPEDWEAHVFPEDAPIVREAVKSCLDGETPHYEQKHRMRHKDGSIRWFLSTGAVERDRNGKPVRMVGSHMDITHQKEIEDERERLKAEIRTHRVQKLQSLRRLAVGVVDEFVDWTRSVLQASRVLDTLSDDSPTWRAIADMRGNMFKTAEFVQKLQFYTGQSAFKSEWVDLNELLEDTRHLCEAFSKGASLEYRLAKELPHCQGDPNQLRIAILNLIENAAESLDGRDRAIVIATGVQNVAAAVQLDAASGEPMPAGRYVFLQITDAGRGMDESARESMFDPFFSTKGDRHGLGLPIALGAVYANHGYLALDTQTGEGTCMTVLLPIAEAASYT